MMNRSTVWPVRYRSTDWIELAELLVCCITVNQLIDFSRLVCPRWFRLTNWVESVNLIVRLDNSFRFDSFMLYLGSIRWTNSSF